MSLEDIKAPITILFTIIVFGTTTSPISASGWWPFKKAQPACETSLSKTLPWETAEPIYSGILSGSWGGQPNSPASKWLVLQHKSFAPPDERETEGYTRITYLPGGYTVMSFWDRSGDQRFGNASTFLFPGALNFQEAEAAARTSFPDIFARFRIPLTLEGYFEVKD